MSASKSTPNYEDAVVAEVSDSENEEANIPDQGNKKEGKTHSSGRLYLKFEECHNDGVSQLCR